MSSDGAHILAALGEQVEWYRKLARLAELQHVYVQGGQTEELLAVLGQRQEVLDHVARLELLVGEARRNWTACVGTMQAEQRSRAEALMAEARKLLEEITTSDRNDALVLQQRKLNLGKQIGKASSARQVNRTYAAAAYGHQGGSILDLSR